MLIEFRVTNYKSIREEQVFSLVASNSDRKNCTENVIEQEIPGMKGVRFLKGAAIYGANASGKSSFMQALEYMKEFVTESATGRKPDQPTGRKPFLLDEQSRQQPSRFEVTFVHAGIRYQYGFAVMDNAVTEEFLTAYPKGAPQSWFLREQGKQSDWPASSYFKGHTGLQEKTRSNALYLSVGAQWNHPQLTPVYHWFTDSLQSLHLTCDHDLRPTFSMIKYASDPVVRRQMDAFLNSADFGINRLEFDDTPKQSGVMNGEVGANGESRGEMREFTPKGFEHIVDGKPYLIAPLEESSGTRRFFAMAAPWIDILRYGRTVFIDELETSLHPVLVRGLLEQLFSEKKNPNGAQVVFTTHNATLLDQTLIRRDQVWFTEKDDTGATHIYPLTDYSPRSGEALAKGYLAGRYGAIPFLEGGLRFDG